MRSYREPLEVRAPCGRSAPAKIADATILHTLNIVCPYKTLAKQRMDEKRASGLFSGGEERGGAHGREGGAGGGVGQIGADPADGAGGDDAVALAGRDVAAKHRVVLHEDDDGGADRG